MKTPIFYLFIAMILLAGCSQPLEGDFIITNVNIIDVETGEVLGSKDVVIAGDKIASIVELRDGHSYKGEVIDGADKYLIPGLWDMHAHTGSDRNTRGVIYPLHVAHGITGIRSMKADCFESGPNACAGVDAASVHEVTGWRRDVSAGELVGPRIVAGSMLVDGPGREGSSVQAPGTEDDARAFARLMKERGVDFIKIYNLLPRDAYFAMAIEANRIGLPFAGHVPITVRVSEASEAGQRTIEHAAGILEECNSREEELRSELLAEATSGRHRVMPIWIQMVESFDEEKCEELYARLARNRTWVVPTLVAFPLPQADRPAWRDDPRLKYLPQDELEYKERLDSLYQIVFGAPEARLPFYRHLHESAAAMHRAGVPLLAGSDAGIPGVFWGWSLHEELEALVAAGLTEADALRAATLGPAQFLGATDSLGTVEAGKLADLVLLDANPLEDISNTQKIRAVIANGRYFDREALDELLAGVERAAQAQERPAAETRMIDVDGLAVHVYTAGWEHLERGQPVVVFEAGGFSTLGTWGELPAILARETAVVAYERAGVGRSEWDGQRPTIEHVVSRLRSNRRAGSADPGEQQRHRLRGPAHGRETNRPGERPGRLRRGAGVAGVA